MDRDKLYSLLEEKFAFYNQPSFIENDPISIPHQYYVLQDIEISGLISSVFAWGLRKTAISKAKEFLLLMDNAPYDFIKNHHSNDLTIFKGFKHRTFNDIDAEYIISALKSIYQKHHSLEEVFKVPFTDNNIENGLINFHNAMFDRDEYPSRTKKHIASPETKASCKRLNMYLRWMVRKDNQGVDFGLWNNIQPSQLIIPTDVHVVNIATQLGLIEKPKSVNWKVAIDLTETLKTFDPQDPTKYDYALFSMGVIEKGKLEG
jgi:uncharacterized protein (TIGR02757 family)